VRYLYGDSTSSPLQSNYLAFFRDAMEFWVHLLLAQQRINKLRDERSATDQYAAAERTRIGGLKALVTEAAEDANHDGAESMSLRAVKSVITASDQAIAVILDELQRKLEADRAALAAKDRHERDECLDAFAKYVALHEAHEGTWRLSAHLDDTGSYHGETSGSAPYGAEWKCAVELQADHPMARGSKVGDLVTQIELPLPEGSGWLKKGKFKPQRIDQYSIDSIETDGTQFSIALRVTPGAPTGLDVTIRGDKIEVTLAGTKEATSVEVNLDNRERLLTLRDRILDALTAHAGVRRRVVTATLDDKPLADGDDLGDVVKRMIDAATPIVKQIRKHSLSPHELVIRRLLGNDRREEIFVSTASLLEKLGRLPRNLRSLFEPLGLEWQRAHTPLPGEIFVEPPRPTLPEPEPATVEVANAEPEPPKAETSESAPSASVPEPVDDGAGSAAGSIEAALLRTSSPSIEVAPVAAGAAPPPPVASTISIDAHSKEALAATVKRIVGVAREGRTPEAYAAYAALFEDNGFAQQRPQDQRQVLKLVLMSKTPPPRSDSVTHAYRSALARLQSLSADSRDPIDDEMIGVCLALLG